MPIFSRPPQALPPQFPPMAQSRILAQPNDSAKQFRELGPRRGCWGSARPAQAAKLTEESLLPAAWKAWVRIRRPFRLHENVHRHLSGLLLSGDTRPPRLER